MMPLFDPSLQEVLRIATTYARKRKNEFITLEHFLWACFQFPPVADFFKNELKADVKKESAELDSYIKKHQESFSKKLNSNYSPEPTIGLHRCIEHSLQQARNANNDRVTPLHILLLAFDEEDSFAVYRLAKIGATPLMLMEHLSHGDALALAPPQKESKNPLKKFCTNLSAKVKAGKQTPFIGRSTELARTLEVLARKTKNNPLLVGDPGVGKTSLGEGLAEWTTQDSAPDRFQNLTVFHLDLASLLAGTKYRGDFEARMKALFSSLEKIENPLLFIDEIHSIVGAGATSGSNVDFASLLKPALSSNHIKIVGTTTYEEYRKHFAKDAALSRRFQAVFVNEPSHEETLQILSGLQKNYEDFHGVVIKDEALKASVELSGKHILDRKWPDKAFDLLDETCAHLSLQKQSLVTEHNVRQTLTRLYKVNEDQASNSTQNLLESLKTQLQAKIFGQNEAINELYSNILVAYSGLKNENQPLGSFLFTGPTGVGKTELSKQLAKHLGLPFVRFDMSEYMEKHTVSKLIGSPPGYVGHEEGGRLTDAVSKTPHCVLLLDEIEKAHPDVINVLLQVMDSGRLTDALGKVTHFNNSIIIMTSNSGAREAEKGSLGIYKAPSGDFSTKALKNFFAPEFLNRLTTIVKFNSLSDDLLKSVVEKNLSLLAETLKSKEVQLSWSSKVVDYILKEAQEHGMGARPFERFVQRKLKPLIAEKLIGSKERPLELKVSIRKGELTV